MPEQLWFTAILNHWLAGPVTALLTALHVPPAFPQAPITNAIAMEIMVILLLLVFFAVVRASLSVENPGTVQHLAEVVEDFIAGQCEEVIGHKTPQFIGFLSTLFLFILIMNLFGLVPTLDSPTATVTVPLGLAVVTWIFYHIHGVKKHGPVKYGAHFFGPMPALAPLMLPIEIISHTARILSLTVRLWANMFAGDLITLVFLSLVPVLLPVVFLGLHVFVSLLQAYIFLLLAIVYLQGAVADEH
jgi:F-type H+-transporting ATPase subunit a